MCKRVPGALLYTAQRSDEGTDRNEIDWFHSGRGHGCEVDGTRSCLMRNPAAGLAVVGLGASLAAMDLAVNVAFPSVTAAFALQTDEIRWLVISYVLTYASLMLAFGRLGDRIGHRRIFRAGLLLSIAAYTLCALAPSYGLLLVARVVQGVATALVLSCAPALATFLFDETRRTRALGAYASLSAVASIVAPLVGGMSIALLCWAGVFWFRVPVAVAAAVLLPMLPEHERPTESPDVSGTELMGSALLAGALVFVLLSFTLALTPGRAELAALAAGGGLAALAGLLVQQRRTASPLLPRSIVRSAGFLLPNLASVALYLVVFAVPLLTPYYLERIAGYSPSTSGAALACSPLGILMGSMLAAAIARRIGARYAALAGGMLVVLGQFAIGLWTDSTQLLSILIVLFIHGLGNGLFGVAYSDIVLAALPASERGVAGSLTMLMRTIGVITGAAALIAALGAIEAREIASGRSAEAAFLQAYASVFHGSALLLAIVLPSCFLPMRSLRRRSHE